MDILTKFNDNNDIDKYTHNHKDILSVTSLYFFIIGVFGLANENIFKKWLGVCIIYIGVTSTIFWDNFEKGSTLHIIDKSLSILYLLQFVIVNTLYGYKFLSFQKTLMYFILQSAFFVLSDKLLMEGNIDGSFWCHIFFRYFTYIAMITVFYPEITPDMLNSFTGIYIFNILNLKHNRITE